MKLIVGLGNPGKMFENTYHNVGFIAIDRLSKILNIEINKTKFNSLFGKGKYEGKEIVLVKPLTYMNLSGEAVKKFSDYYALSPEEIIVLCDDAELHKGTSRYREHGSSGGHNGLKSIQNSLSSKEYQRVRIGVWRDDKMDLKDYVLSQIGEDDFSLISKGIDDALVKVLDKIR